MSQTAPTQQGTHLFLKGEMMTPLAEGALWWADQRVLIVSDLHLEKGSSYAARGQLLPPYDTHATLACVSALCDRLQPETVISLGDSFHDRSAELRLPETCAQQIRALTERLDWVWVEGNHDPDPPAHLGGRATKALRIGSLVFRHEPTGEDGEVAGHLHPAIKIKGRGRTLRRRCFVSDGDRLIMPALGSFTGGLNLLDPAFAEVFPDGFLAFALGEGQVYTIARPQMIPDTPSGARWRL